MSYISRLISIADGGGRLETYGKRVRIFKGHMKRWGTGGWRVGVFKVLC